MRAVSLFSGVGGFEIGFDRAGIDTVLQVEIDPHCQSVLERHWPDTERVSDVREVGLQERKLARGSSNGTNPSRREDLSEHPDLVYGGFPCQPFSVAGQRAGDRDDRNLWPEFERVVRELRPRWVVAENVPGLLSIDGGRFFGGILDSLGELGFEGVAYAVLDAQHFGVPQRRRRVFIVGGPDRHAGEQILSICEGCGGHPAKSGKTGEGVAYALRAEPSHSGDKGDGGLNTTLVATLEGIAGTLGGGAADSGRGFRNDLDSHGAYIPSAEPFAFESRLARNGRGRPTDIVPPLKAESGQTGKGDGAPLVAAPLRSRSSLDSNMPERGGEDDQNLVVGALDVHDADKWGSNQWVDQDKALVAPAGVRRLTPLECERLMGWPDDWTRYGSDGKELADSHRYRMIGNGVVAPVAEWIGRRLVALDGTPAGD